MLFVWARSAVLALMDKASGFGCVLCFEVFLSDVKRRSVMTIWRWAAMPAGLVSRRCSNSIYEDHPSEDVKDVIDFLLHRLEWMLTMWFLVKVVPKYETVMGKENGASQTH